MPKRQPFTLSTLATGLSILVALQSYGTLPYQMSDMRTRLASIETDHRTNRDLTIELRAQLVATREEIATLRAELTTFRTMFLHAGGVR